jgi:hypothetical protein
MITCTAELARTLKNAQLAHVKELIDVELAGSMSDDHYDYLTAGLSLAERLCHIDYNQDLNDLDTLLNVEYGDGETLRDFASDGICNAIYELNPPALKDE